MLDAIIAEYKTDAIGYNNSVNVTSVAKNESEIYSTGRDQLGEPYLKKITLTQQTVTIPSGDKGNLGSNKPAKYPLLKINQLTSEDNEGENVSLADKRLSPKSERIIRTHFVKQILNDLNRLCELGEDQINPIFVSKIMHAIRLYRDLSPFDPYANILIAFYDAIAYQNRWTDFSIGQYRGVNEILKSYASQEITEKKTSKAIMKLERLGFDTTPFELDGDFALDEYVLADE